MEGTAVSSVNLGEVLHNLLSGDGNTAALQNEFLTDEAGNYRITQVEEPDLLTDRKGVRFVVQVDGEQGPHFEVIVAELT